MERGSRALLASVLAALVTAATFVAGQESKASSEASEPRSRIEVQVVDPSGAVIQSARITIQSGESYVVHGQTNASGVFSVQGLTVGEYRVSIESGGFLGESTTVSVRERSVGSVLVQLEPEPALPPGGIMGTVYNVEPITSNTTSEILYYPDLEHLPLDGGPMDLHFQNRSQPNPKPNLLRRFFSAVGRKLGFA